MTSTHTLLPDDIPTPAAGHSTAHRLNGLDGFRALAVVVVVLYHFNVPGFAGGWMGPELFFVLSGYLITTLLLDRKGKQSAVRGLIDFWVRRIRRLYPALLFLVAALVGIVALLSALRDPVVVTVSPIALRSESFASMGYYANWHLIAQHVDYFGQSTALLKHMWSLAIEEQFYLIFPLVFLLMTRSARYWRACGLGVAIAGATVSAILCSSYASGGSLLRAYYSTETNAYHLLIGVGLAFALHGWAPDRRARRILTWCTLLGFAAIIVFVQIASTADGSPRHWMFSGGGVLLDLCGALLIAGLVYGSHQGPVSWLFNRPVIVWIGAVSYGIYLWHYPFAVLLQRTNTHVAHGWVVLLQIAGTLAMTAFSYYFIERVVRETQIPSARLRWTLYGASVLVCVLLVAYSPQIISAAKP